MIKFNELMFNEKLACIYLFPEEARKDDNWIIRLEAHRGFGYTEEAKNDTDINIRNEAELYFRIKKQLEEETTEEQTIQLNGKMYKLIEIIK